MLILGNQQEIKYIEQYEQATCVGRYVHCDNGRQYIDGQHGARPRQLFVTKNDVLCREVKRSFSITWDWLGGSDMT